MAIGASYQGQEATHFESLVEQFLDEESRGWVEPVAEILGDLENGIRCAQAEGAGKKPAIQARIATIQRELDKSTSDYDKEKLSERIAKLSTAVGRIRLPQTRSPDSIGKKR